MIDPKELMIGNLFQDKEGRLCDVSRIEETFEDCRITAINGPMTTMPIEPMPITKDWLYENKIQDQISKYAIRKNIYSGGYIIYKCHDCMCVQVKFVHEIQNWYYWNSNKTELEIK